MGGEMTLDHVPLSPPSCQLPSPHTVSHPLLTHLSLSPTPSPCADPNCATRAPCHRPWVLHGLTARAVTSHEAPLSSALFLWCWCFSCLPCRVPSRPVLPSSSLQPARRPHIPFPVTAHGFLPL